MDDNSSATEEEHGTYPAPFRTTTVIPSNTVFLPFLAVVAREFCRQAVGLMPGIEEQFYFNVELVVTEAVVNSIRHAYEDGEGQVELQLNWADDRLTIRVTDHGSTFTDFDAYAAREIDELDPLSTGGRGIIIIRSLMDTVSYTSDPHSGQNVMEMVKSFSPTMTTGDG